MKRILILCLVLLMSLSVSISCDKKDDVPQTEQIKMISELATLKCKFNNVAKSNVDKGKGLTHVFEKDREYWIEYEGYVDIGIDVEFVTIEINDSVVNVSMPPAKIQNIGVIDDTNRVEIYSKDSAINKNTVTAEKQAEAIAEAQENMLKQVENKKELFIQAEEQAKCLIENYIKNLGELTDTEYTINWKMIETEKET